MIRIHRFPLYHAASTVMYLPYGTGISGDSPRREALSYCLQCLLSGVTVRGSIVGPGRRNARTLFLIFDYPMS